MKNKSEFENLFQLAYVLGLTVQLLPLETEGRCDVIVSDSDISVSIYNLKNTDEKGALAFVQEKLTAHEFDLGRSWMFYLESLKDNYPLLQYARLSHTLFSIRDLTHSLFNLFSPRVDQGIFRQRAGELFVRGSQEKPLERPEDLLAKLHSEYQGLIFQYLPKEVVPGSLYAYHSIQVSASNKILIYQSDMKGFESQYLEIKSLIKKTQFNNTK